MTLHRPVLIILGVVIGAGFIGGGVLARKFPGVTAGNPPVDQGPAAAEEYRKKFENAKRGAGSVLIGIGVLIVLGGLVGAFV
jgi:hypothetical protein